MSSRKRTHIRRPFRFLSPWPQTLPKLVANRWLRSRSPPSRSGLMRLAFSRRASALLMWTRSHQHIIWPPRERCSRRQFDTHHWIARHTRGASPLLFRFLVDLAPWASLFGPQRQFGGAANGAWAANSTPTIGLLSIHGAPAPYFFEVLKTSRPLPAHLDFIVKLAAHA